MKMKQNTNKKAKKQIIIDIIIFLVILSTSIVLMIIFPDKKGSIIKNSKDFFMEMIFILPAVMILMGFFAVWVSNEAINKYLGNASGIKGMMLAFLMGALPTGPLYVAFPLANSLSKKGASVKNIVIFLSAWACIKLPQEIVEIQFLGIKFMAIRLILTIVFVSIMAIFIDFIYRKTNN